MEQTIRECTLCPRMCHALRTAERGNGFCRMGTLPKIARCAPHFGEEPCISGTRGSGTIFFTGCVLSCIFCQNYPISREGVGRTVTIEELIQYVKGLEQQGVHNINLVSPTPYTDALIEAFSQYRPNIPILWNTGGYERPETLRRLEGLIDIYLPDLKYVSPDLSGTYSGASDYFTHALPAIHEMVRQTGAPQFDDSGMMTRGTIVRHLVLPGHTKNSLAVLDCLNREFGSEILVSLMGQYVPFGKAEQLPPLNRRLTKREYEKVLLRFESLALDGYCQELSSAAKSFIPEWNIL